MARRTTEEEEEENDDRIALVTTKQQIFVCSSDYKHSHRFMNIILHRDSPPSWQMQVEEECEILHLGKNHLEFSCFFISLHAETCGLRWQKGRASGWMDEVRYANGDTVHADEFEISQLDCDHIGKKTCLQRSNGNIPDAFFLRWTRKNMVWKGTGLCNIHRSIAC